MLVLAYIFAKPILAYVDNHFFDDLLRDSRAKIFYKEDWGAVPQLPRNLDYSWVNAERPLRIGHALGASGSINANQLAALADAHSSGLRVLEVDIWLTEDDELRCFHGPGEPGPFLFDSCNFERLLLASSTWKPWLMLDIKTDYSKTAKRIIKVLQKYPQESNRIIFQLYQPIDIVEFKKLNSDIQLAGPVITGYASNSSTNMLVKAALLSGIKVLTMTFQRKESLTANTEGLSLMVHPIHDCFQFNRAISSGFNGVYTLSGLRC